MIENLFDNLKCNALRKKTGDEIQDLVALAELFAIDGKHLKDDLAGLIKERILMHLVGDVPAHLNFGERQRFIARRLKNLSGNLPEYQPTPKFPEVTALTEIQQAVISAVSETKDGVAGLDERSALDTMEMQGFRCDVCGTPLRASVRRQSNRFPDGMEPLCNHPHLDHVIPHYFFGNEGGRRILCVDCNLVKNDRIGVQEDGFVVSGNHVRRRDGASIRRRMIFWTLEALRRCGHEECVATSKSSILCVQSRRPDVPFMYGNLDVRCDAHASRDASWIHSH